MDTLRAALGIGDGAAVGDAVHAELGGAGSLDGVIDYLTAQFIGVRDDGLWRFFGRNHFGHVVGMSARTCSATTSTRRGPRRCQGLAGLGLRVGVVSVLRARSPLGAAGRRGRSRCGP